MGGDLLLKSLDQSSLLTIGSMTASLHWEREGAGDWELLVAMAAPVSTLLGGWETPVWLASAQSGRLPGWDGGWEAGWVVGTREVSGSFVGLPSGDSFAGPFGLKNPLSVFCPAAGALAAVEDFERFNEIEGGGSLFSFRLRVVPLAILSSVPGIGLVGVLLAVFSFDAVVSRSPLVVRSTLVIEVDFCRELAGLRVNMSLMLLLLSNSGIKRPDVGRRYLAEYSCCRPPSLNMPGGFTMSWILTCSPSTVTESLNTA